ncbi:Stress-induced-phosphoprotein 1 [Dissophora globulifera]|uniref:Stress-induced-phosphoprotein 1 n=1 Tax=Dissophora globulifera TaxID=979702 RepID=A0A9P6UL99_9FUNG|nr:Stress-induced-phosphoprotein 1 [Dissophora globulifera]
MVTSVAYSPSGHQIASGSYDNTVRLWDAQTGAPGLILSGHTDPVWSVAYSPSGHQIASGSVDKTVRLWDAHTSAAGPILSGHTGRVESVAYSPCGHHIASGSDDGTVRLWDAQTGITSLILSGHTDWVISVTYSPSGHQIASGSHDRTVRLWNAQTGAPGPVLSGHTEYVNSVVYSPSGLQIASGSGDNTIRLWDAQTGAPGPIVSGHTECGKSVAHSPSGRQIASGSGDNTMRSSDSQPGAIGPILNGYTEYVNTVAYSPNYRQIASGSGDNTVRLWDSKTRANGLTLSGHTDWITIITYSPSGRQIASGSRDQTVRLWNAQTGAPGPTLSGHTDWVTGVTYSPTGHQIVTGSRDDTVRLWDAQTGAPGPILSGHTDWIRSVAYSPSGHQIASGSHDRTVRLWDAQAGAAGPILIGHTDWVTNVTYSPSGHQIASGSHDRTVRLWDAHTGAPGLILSGHTNWVWSVAYSPRGHQIASGSCSMNSAEFNNWCKIELLLVKASECLRKAFEQSWQHKYKVAWSNSPESGQHFANNVGLGVYRYVGKIQKDYLERGDIRKWDLTIFNAIFTITNLNRDKVFQAKLKRLMLIRNSIAHHSDKKISTQEYQQHWSELKAILLFLGVTDEELDDTIHSHSSDSKMYIMTENVKKSIELKDQGNNLAKEQKFLIAVTKYTDAITLPGISDRDLSVLYSNRSHCYVMLGEYDQALEDAKLSKRLNPDYVKAYIRLGKAYESLRKYDKAIKNFDKALSLDMNNDDIRKMRSEARKLKGLQERDNDQRIKDLNLKSRQGFKDMKNKDEIKKLMFSHNPALEHVWAGHDFRDDQNYSMAAERYKQAADMHNAEGMYNLALFMIYGHGVSKDYPRALKLLLEVSKFDAIDKFNIPVVGVKEAEHCIALGYHEGSIAEKSIELAVVWYEKAISHGNGMSANNLALMYMNGDGVVKNFKQAEQLFLCALNYDDPNAMDNLVTLYLASGNINKTGKWNEKSKKQGSKIARLKEKTITQMELESNANISDVIDWEKELNLPFENLTIQLRNKSDSVSPAKITNGYKYDLEVLAKRKDKSEFSNRMYSAVLNFMEAMDTFHRIARRSTVVLDNDSRSFIGRLAMCYKLEHFVGSMQIDIREVIRKHVLLLLSESDRAIRHSKDIDELAFNQDCRICHAVLNMQSDENIDFLTECIKKYPNNKFFLEIRGCLYNFIDKREFALRDFNRIEEISKDDVNNLYHKAATLNLMGRDKQATDAYTRFLLVASADHRQVPETYYSLGVCNMADRNMDSIARYYEQGLNAEEKQIPFFLPYESTSKEILELMLRTIGGLSKGKGKPVVKLVDRFRKELIVNHRRNVSDFSKIMSSDKHTKINFTTKPSKIQSVPLSLVGLKPIYLNDIDPTLDHVLDGFVLELTLITVPFNDSMSIFFVAEDSNLNVQRVNIYNFDKNKSWRLEPRSASSIRISEEPKTASP